LAQSTSIPNPNRDRNPSPVFEEAMVILRLRRHGAWLVVVRRIHMKWKKFIRNMSLREMMHTELVWRKCRVCVRRNR